MKKILFALTTALIFINTIFAQNQIDSLLKNDEILSKINAKLPSGWTMNISDSSLIISSNKQFALINADCDEVNAQQADTAKRDKKAYILYSVEKKWDAQKMFLTKEWNDSISLRISTLPREFGVTSLQQRDENSRRIIYVAKTKADEEKIAKFNKRKDELVSQKITYPNLNTSTLSLFQKERTCAVYGDNCIVPNEIKVEEQSIYILLLDFCKNPMREYKK